MNIFITKIASVKLTFVLLLMLLFTIIVAYNGEFSWVTWLALPLVLLLLNLVAAIFSNKAFRSNLPLLLFHLTLLLTVLLVALSRLTYLDAHVELFEGEVFDGKLAGQKNGLLHQYSLKAGDFTNIAVQLEFTPMVAITAIRSRVLVATNAGPHEVVIGEHKPLVINNYRFYVSRNVGYSAVFSWQALQENSPNLPTETGTIHFPPFLTNQFNQSNSWQVPNSDIELWFMLQPEEDLLAERKSIQLAPPQNHYMVVRNGEDRQELRVGHQLHLPQGILTYHGLRTWMGYKVHYDPFKAYLLATSLLTVLCLAWFFWQKFNQRSWLTPVA
ncbi:hypothetical protein A9Q98_08595 [Thalassotalea sp. 42_200_T64]|nr:hypothetical protein A9Q98_08595 [Thalassotalea sp. 42_200_T64]